MTRASLIVIWTILSVLLFLRFFSYFTSQPQYKAGQSVSIEGNITSAPVVKGNVARFDVGNLHIVTGRFPSYNYGDHIKVIGTVSARVPGDQKNGVLKKIRQDIVLYYPKIEASKSNSNLGTAFLLIFPSMSGHIKKQISGQLPVGSASLLSGILLGSKEGFSQDFSDALRNTGTLHVVAASGMNVSLFASFVTTFLSRFFNRRIVAIIVILTIFLYAGLASFQPAIIRAAIMGSLAFAASALNRGAQAGWGLLLAGFAMLAIEPFLLFDIGFQLSFVATAGLLFLMPVFEDRFKLFARLKEVPLLGDGASTTIVAQAATLPILLANFGNLSIASILVNTIVLWTVPTIMFLGISASITSFLPFFPSLFLLASYPFLAFFEKIVLLFNQSQFVITLQIPFLMALGYYCLLMGLYFFLRKRV